MNPGKTYALVMVMLIAPFGTVHDTATHVIVSPSMTSSPSITSPGVTSVPLMTNFEASVPSATVVAAQAGGTNTSVSSTIQSGGWSTQDLRHIGTPLINRNRIRLAR